MMRDMRLSHSKKQGAKTTDLHRLLQESAKAQKYPSEMMVKGKGGMRRSSKTENQLGLTPQLLGKTLNRLDSLQKNVAQQTTLQRINTEAGEMKGKLKELVYDASTSK